MQVRLELRPGPGETLDAICGGEVQVLQRRLGYRFSLDPILLAHFAVYEGGAHRGRLMDLGTGSGIIPLVLAGGWGAGTSRRWSCSRGCTRWRSATCT